MRPRSGWASRLEKLLYTVTHAGDRSVPIRTTGHEKGRFTVVLAAMANARKLHPYVVFVVHCQKKYHGLQVIFLFD